MLDANNRFDTIPLVTKHWTDGHRNVWVTRYHLGCGERDDMPPADGSSADLRPSADGSAVRIWLSCRQPACLYPRAAPRLWLGQTDGLTDGRI